MERHWQQDMPFGIIAEAAGGGEALRYVRWSGLYESDSPEAWVRELDARDTKH